MQGWDKLLTKAAGTLEGSRTLCEQARKSPGAPGRDFLACSPSILMLWAKVASALKLLSVALVPVVGKEVEVQLALRMFLDQIFVQGQAQSRRGGQIEVAVHHFG